MQLTCITTHTSALGKKTVGGDSGLKENLHKLKGYVANVSGCFDIIDAVYISISLFYQHHLLGRD